MYWIDRKWDILAIYLKLLQVSALTAVSFFFNFVTYTSAYANQPAQTMDEVYSLSLEELMQIEVVSKTKESVSNSPALVSTYHAEQLLGLGLHSLKDFLHFVPGLEINETLNGGSVIQIRGLPSASNQKILFFIK